MTRPLVLIVVLASLESLQAQSSAAIPAAVHALRTAHAQALISVANQALDLRLVNDAERLQLAPIS